MENIMQRRLRLWKARQEAEGYDVSKVTTLEEAEHFFDKKPKRQKKKANIAADAANNGEGEMNPPGPAGHPPLDKGGNETPQGEGLGEQKEEAPKEAEATAPEMPKEEVIEDEQCDIDPPGMPE